MSRQHVLPALLLALVIGLALRAPSLGERPLHNDEAVNGVKFGQLWEQGKYRYDPNEHHGPTLYYATLALGRLTGGPPIDQFSEARLRAVTVLFGIGLIPLLLLLKDGLGRSGLAWAALFTAVSPALVFYSRYFIHESLLTFFTFLAIGAGWRYLQTRKLGWALLTGGAVGLMAATKETFVITLVAAGMALVANGLWSRALAVNGEVRKTIRFRRGHLVAAMAAGLVLAGLFFTSFFTNASGPLDALRTYLPWVHRAGGDSPHIYPWHFYLHRLLFFHPAKSPVWTEALILALALLASWAGFARRGVGAADAALIRFLSLYSIALTCGYSILPYKTPWCLLSFWHGFVLLAGVGAAWLCQALRHRFARAAIILLLLAGAAHLVWQTWQLDTVYAADHRNPYAYSPTSRDLAKLVNQVESLADVDPQKRQMLLKVISPEDDYWPLPWYLRSFKQVGWYDRLPADPYAPAMIVSAKLHAELDEKKTHLMAGYFELRPQVFLELYVSTNLWTDWLVKHPPPKDD